MSGKNSGKASLRFGHANANFSVFKDRIRNQFLKKLFQMNNDNYLNLHSMTKFSGWLCYWAKIATLVV